MFLEPLNASTCLKVTDQPWSTNHGGMTEMRHGKFTGSWKDGQPLDGDWVVPGGVSYLGTWQDGKRNGQGTMKFPDGAK